MVNDFFCAAQIASKIMADPKHIFANWFGKNIK